MPVSKVSLFSIGKKSAESLFFPRRYVTRMGFHSSSYMRAAKMSNEGRRLLLGQGQLESPLRRVYLIPTVILGGIGGAFIFWHMNDEKRAIHKGQGSNDGCCTMKGPVIGGPFNLIDSHGRLVTEEDLRGGWILLYFGYTSSPDVGPAELLKLAKAINTLESKYGIKVRPVFVTIDPQRDTPSQLRAYLKEFDERIMGLTGPVGAVRQMAHEYRVYFKKVEEDGDDYLVESSHNMYLMNPCMEIVRTFGLEYNAEQLSEQIHNESRKTGA
ncbi:protein SCO1 homolog 2, mitochondrial [Cynara cardunculus var. scolymus]|uniref:protein SCO1 homolog 2, mitochondrial n=1 Tax=Cynara cardunculus var. scolymus TaxID=59895 RepID=UPI000D62B4B2|nr:protein SCO1 homolog 2, mitochondrial [Cynara cardunculus var. scolymus]